MAYFNHAFCKTFLGTKVNSSQNPNFNPNQSDEQGGPFGPSFSGFIIDNQGIPSPYKTVNLADGTLNGANLGVGSFGFFDPKTWESVTLQTPVAPCCPLVLASAALYQKDGIGQPFSGGGATGNFHGGYQESNKSKVINPKYVSRVYRVDPCVPNQNVIHVGATPWTLSQGKNCCKEFLCDQSYSLRLDIKGSPTLRYLNHNAYFETATWTGCCAPNPPTGAPTPVDPTTVYISWATQLLNSPLISPFIQITIYDQNGNNVGGANDTAAWEAYLALGVPFTPCGVPGVPGAGMSIVGAYVGTVFGDCTFYPTDFFEKEPVKILASMVDYTGDVCEFEGICVNESCCPRQGNGFGDTVLKDLILSERYLQNDFNTGSDLRIREITQGYDVTNAVNRSSFYTRYVIQHNVPRWNNPTGVFDNDQYLLEIITNGRDGNLEAFLSNWIVSPTCGPCGDIEEISCGDICCVPLALSFEVGATVNYTIQVPGTAPFQFSPVGSIGAGLSLSASGVISGTYTGGGINPAVQITAQDAHLMQVGCFDLTVSDSL